MATVTALTAQKTLALIAPTITGASLSSEGVLTFHRQNNTSFPVGNVRGPSGAAASETMINDAVAAAVAALPQGALGFDEVTTNQSISADGGGWYPVASLYVSGTIINGRVYSVEYSATVTSTAALKGVDLEVRVGDTYSTATPLDRDTTFSYDNGRGLGMGGTAKFKGTSSFNGTKKFMIGFRISDDATLSIRNEVADGGNPATILLIDHGIL